MGRLCELAACGRTDTTRCHGTYLCPTCRPLIEQPVAERLAEPRPPQLAKGTPVVWAGQTGAWILHEYEDDHTAWIHRPGIRMLPTVGRPGGGLVDLAPYAREPEHMELVPVAELRPAVVALAGGA
ncbi:hypothetical protein ABZW11_26365 [Nonomuraea sp. NPDC004580]|uniref:hypothetical protein n=1 Tax=Nonomuraea sp. NPDC004580 TaxID=3154552 RepID=UPI0033AB1118